MTITDPPVTSVSELETRDQILRSHRDLAAVLGNLTGATDPALLADNLDHLHDVLARHFALEERSEGLYAILRVRARHADRTLLDTMLGEHVSLLADLRVLLAQARARPSPLIVARAQQYCDRVRDHERRETRMLVQTLSCDEA